MSFLRKKNVNAKRNSSEEEIFEVKKTFQYKHGKKTKINKNWGPISKISL